MLSSDCLTALKKGKNLLAFSAGVDSSALFSLLLEADISFDIAIVNYKMRTQADEEVAYAQALAKQHHKNCFVLEKALLVNNFESQARNIRYDFFETLISQHHYTHLLTAHQLDDRLEWFLMQLTKGAGLHELSGMQTIELRPTHTLVRPLLETSKSELLEYLQKHHIRYFEDVSNLDASYKRNYFRHNISAPLLKQFKKGISKSFTYLQEDHDLLYCDVPKHYNIEDLYYFKQRATRRINIITADKILKSLGFLMRQGDKEQLKVVDTHIVGRQYVVCFQQKYCFIAPYISVVMEKAFKERSRKLQIPSKLRGYLSEHTQAADQVFTLLEEGL